MNARVLTTLGVCAWFLLPGCSSSPTAGGGSDLPNGAVALLTGTVLLPDSTPAQDVDAVLREIVVSSTGDSVVSEQLTVTDSTGTFWFEAVAAGRYVLLIEESSGLAAVDQFVEVGDSGVVRVPALRLCRRVDLVGFVELPAGYFYSNVRVWVPGVCDGSRADLNRMYLLSNVPQGHYDVALSYGDVVNYLRVEVRQCMSSDSTVQMRNVQFAVVEAMAQTAHPYHVTTAVHSYSVVPIQYERGQEPPWYSQVVLSRVVYYDWDGDQPTEWVPGGTPPVPVYDAVVSGVVHRELNGQVVLESTAGMFYVLTGPLVGFVGPNPVAVTVAVVVRGAAYEVVDIYVHELAPN